jgi:hypothetical protein
MICPRVSKLRGLMIPIRMFRATPFRENSSCHPQTTTLTWRWRQEGRARKVRLSFLYFYCKVKSQESAWRKKSDKESSANVVVIKYEEVGDRGGYQETDRWRTGSCRMLRSDRAPSFGVRNMTQYKSPRSLYLK